MKSREASGLRTAVMAALRLVLGAMAVLASSLTTANSVLVAPIIGPWQYTHQTCDSPKGPFDSESAAINHSLMTRYNRCGDAQVSAIHPWGTPEQQNYGPCGSDKRYPKFFMGLEAVNNMGVWVSYCERFTGSFQVFRRRSITCPPGYERVGNHCRQRANVLVPDKVAGPPECSNDGAASATDSSPVRNGSNPINEVTGNKYQRERDIHDSVGALSFSRHYNSRPALTDSLAEPGLPLHWRHEYSRAIQLRHAAVLTARLSRPDGRAWSFSRGADGVWRADGDVPGRLEALMDGDQILGWEYQGANNQLERFDAQGRLIEMRTAAGEPLWFSYLNGRLHTATNRHGAALTFEYYAGAHSAAGWLQHITGPGGEQWRYDYDATGNLVAVHHPDDHGQSGTRRYHYNEPEHIQGEALPHALTGITHEHGQRYATFRYDDAGRAISSEHGSNGANRVQVSYNADGSRSLTDALGTTRDYQYQRILGVARVSSMSSPCSQCGDYTELTERNSNGQVVRSVNFRGVETRQQFGSPHWPDLATQRISAFGTAEQHTVSTEWHARWRLPVRRASAGRLMHWQYQDDNGIDCGGYPGALCQQTEWATDDINGAHGLNASAVGEPRITRWQYVESGAAAGQILSVQGPRLDVSDITHFEYHPHTGYRSAMINAAGHRTLYQEHDAWGRPLRMVDPNNVVTRYRYHPRGWLLEIDVAGAITRFDYDESGQLIGVQGPEGTSMQMHYDDAKRLIEIRDGSGNALQYSLNALGERIEERVVDAQGNVLTALQREYDPLNRMRRLIDGEGNASHYDYDLSGNVRQSVSPSGHASDYHYDALNRLQRISDALQGQTRFDYDRQGRLTGVEDANQAQTRYHYDGFGNLLTLTSADTGITTHEYDLAGNRLRSTDARGVTVLYQYDALNRLTMVRYPDSQHDATLSYDQGEHGVGRLTRIDEAHVRLGFGYDARGNLNHLQQELMQQSLAVSYQHDRAGKLTGIGYPSGIQLLYQRDAQGRVGAVQAWLQDGQPISLATDIQYQPFGGLQSLQHGNGVMLTREYDRAGRLTRHREHPVQDLHFNYDADGNLISRTMPHGTEHYGYDALQRLHSASGGFGQRQYQYDPVGNRLQRTANGGDEADITHYVYQSASNRLLQAGDTQYHYDNAGNPLAIGELVHRYDDRNRLQAILHDDQPLAEYQYNLLGQRVAKILPDDGAAQSEWHRQQADLADAEAARLSAALVALELDQAMLEAQRQAALNLADSAQQQAAAQRSQAATLQQQANTLDARADQHRAAAQQYQQRADDALANRRSGLFGLLVNWWYELEAWIYQSQADSETTEANRLAEKAAEDRAQAIALESSAHQYDADASIRLAHAAMLEQQLASIDNQRISKQISLSEMIAAAAWHREQADQPHSGSNTTLFVYSQEGLLLGEYQEDGQPVREYIYLDSVPLALLHYRADSTTPTITWYHTDQLGTPQALTNVDGNIVWQARYSPFGTAELLVNIITQPLRFPGQYYDEESGLHYNYFRYYDASLGRYLRSDPIGLRGGVNTYGYASQRPTFYIDLLGLNFFIPSASQVASYQGYSGASSQAVAVGVNGCNGECAKLNAYIGLHIKVGMTIGSGLAGDVVLAGASHATLRSICAAGVIGTTICSGKFYELDDVVKHANLVDRVRKESELCRRPMGLQY